MEVDSLREKYIWEKIILGKEKATYRKQIRKRKSYKMWERMWEELEGKTREEILLLIFRIMDNAKAFGSATHAGYVKESLLLFLEDKGWMGIK
ncbi:MAG: hypothetical protein OH337_04130 [Candidatus Parvarchaeota archaeon]|nr:hypothetical protein [Candidatus Haiyanarchaeum thermophilum]